MIKMRILVLTWIKLTVSYMQIGLKGLLLVE